MAHVVEPLSSKLEALTEFNLLVPLKSKTKQKTKKSH
jgi:hypothetical protein